MTNYPTTDEIFQKYGCKTWPDIYRKAALRELEPLDDELICARSAGECYSAGALLIAADTLIDIVKRLKELDKNG